MFSRNIRKIILERFYPDVLDATVRDNLKITSLEALLAEKDREAARAAAEAKAFLSQRKATEQYMAGVSDTMREIVETSVEQIRQIDSMRRDFSALITDIRLVVDSMNDMHGAFKQVAEGAKQVALLAGESSSSCQAGGVAMRNASASIERLGASVREISASLEQIKKIAASTNLLALNAVIEAAGAGEAGRGFAVVAGEVKSLARESAARAEEIKIRIATLDQAMREVSKLTQISSGRERGDGEEAGAGSVMELFAAIAGAAGRTSEFSGKIVNDMEEQVFSARGLADYAGQLTKAVEKASGKNQRFLEDAVSLGSMARSAMLMFHEIDGRERDVEDLMDEAIFAHRSMMVVVRGWILKPETVEDPAKIKGPDKCAFAALRGRAEMKDAGLEGMDAPGGAHRAFHAAIVEAARVLEPVKNNPSMPESERAGALTKADGIYSALWPHSDSVVELLRRLQRKTAGGH